MNNDSQRPEEGELQAPGKLLEALVDLHNESIFVPPAVDEAILNEARGHLGKSANRIFPWPPLPYWAAAAASFVLVTWLVYTFARPSLKLGGTFAREDINHDGRVDVLDAFSLAQQVELKKAGDRRMDLNGDGVIDRRDAEVIASHVVRLEKGGS